MILENHIAFVLNVTDDADKTFGIKVQLDEIIPGEEYPEIAYPLFPANFIKMPKPGQQVEVVVPAQEVLAEPGEGTLGVEDFPEFIYYTGRIFDLKDGKPPAELKANYPKRTGWWLEDGTIIYLDETDGSKEIALVLAGGDNFLRIKEQELTAQLGAQVQIKLTPTAVEAKFQSETIKLDSTGCTITDTITKIGGAGAANPLLKGTETITAFGAMFGAWATALGVLAGSAGLPPDVLTYANAMVVAVSAIQGTLVEWPSKAHFQDGR